MKIQRRQLQVNGLGNENSGAVHVSFYYRAVPRGLEGKAEINSAYEAWGEIWGLFVCFTCLLPSCFWGKQRRGQEATANPANLNASRSL